jgi:hypothetical protein
MVEFEGFFVFFDGISLETSNFYGDWMGIQWNSGGTHEVIMAG